MVASLSRHFSADRLRATLLSADALREPVREASLLVNCTSVGMRHGPDPQGTPLPEPAGGLLGPHLLVCDLVYNPARTPLLRSGGAAGARTRGLPMLIYQGPGLRALDGSSGPRRGDDGARPEGPGRAAVAGR